MVLTGYKTYIFGLIVTILGVLQTDPNFAGLLGSHSGLVTSLIGVAILVLRSLTNTPPLQSAPASVTASQAPSVTVAPADAIK